ncbi:MAG TPA: MarR family transcriptional regulator [Hypericibacter adhaerens]|jgi:DNA-binding MarR family transcriptional regulator|uniref:MarR family transcriptional regulator n=1 Tax=Hypericibacter adhaerens TaxID=2602016 RepID=A0A5J6N0F7_9PROT|nr:MarR family transcriptional regulator [Hypericibacter adhaerens]QEX22583.1 MarR family transcriptional regulator [Hypericibacter adhaerens]HWA41901.1 MarR family transcriptional regulator [Hypericibacter adhaerens]
MSDYNPERSFGFLLYDAARLLRRDFDRRARSLGLTRAQWSVLAHLKRNEGLRQAAVADTLELEPITLVRLLDRLEAAGWVERRPDPTDRRARQLFLTEKARPVLDQLMALATETRAVALAGFSEAEREVLIDALIKVRANLSSRDVAGEKPANRHAPSRLATHHA